MKKRIAYFFKFKFDFENSNIKLLLLFVVIFFSHSLSIAQAPNLLWKKTPGGIKSDGGNGVATDANGNSIVVGYFQSTTINFGAITLSNTYGAGISPGSTPGIGDVFLVKYDPFGNVLWAKSFGGIGTDQGVGISTDANGNIFIVGTFESSIITIGSTTLTNVGTTDIFIAKYDPFGNNIWAKSAGGISIDEVGGICTNSTGDIIITGSFKSPSITFDTIALTNTSYGYKDIFLVKYNANGDIIWAQSNGGISDDKSHGICTDLNGNVLITGYFSSSITFASTTLTTVGGYDIFIAKYDSGGNILWAKSEGGLANDVSQSIATDENGNILIAGYFTSSSLTFGTTTFLKTGYTDMFLSKYDSLGNFIWAKSAVGLYNEFVYSISCDLAGNVFIIGGFSSLSISIGTTVLSSTLPETIFIAKYDQLGNVLWAKSTITTKEEYGKSLSVDPSGNLLATGYFWATPYSCADYYEFVAETNIILLKMCQNPSHSSQTITSCSNYVWGAKTYTTSGIYKDTIQNSFGCDSIMTLNLTIKNTSSSAQSVSTCYNYFWNGNNYNLSGTYVDTLISAIGCDSLATLNLIINSTSSTQLVTTCENYFWNGNNYNLSGTYVDTNTSSLGCDSIMTLNLTIKNSSSSTQNISSCTSYFWNGNNYNESGIYLATIPNSTGCDSIMTLNLTIKNTSSSAQSVSTCYNYFWNGNNYNISGTYIDTLISAIGCDSLATLNLTVNSTSSTQLVTTCENYFWNGNNYNLSGTYVDTNTSALGCDSIMTLNLTIKNSSSSTQTASSCNSYFWNGNNYIESGTYVNTLINSVGCDSLATLNLTINTIDTLVNTSLNSLTANASFGTYQWLDCNNNFAIIPADSSNDETNNQTYYPSINGNYAVALNQNGCIDTSACYTIALLSMIENLLEYTFTIYPNPAEGDITITYELASDKKNGTIAIFDIIGKKVKSINLFDRKGKINIKHRDLETGIYVCNLISNNEIISTKRIVIKN